MSAQHTPTGRADCTVRALATVAEITYALAEEIAADGGRRRGRKVKSENVIAAAKARGVRFRKIRFSARTLGKFIRQHPVGRFYVRKRGHAFAVIDGTVHDSKESSLGCIVIDAWQLERAEAGA
jgi:hypothetical protein